jgi:hypothetical protein
MLVACGGRVHQPGPASPTHTPPEARHASGKAQAEGEQPVSPDTVPPPPIECSRLVAHGQSPPACGTGWQSALAALDESLALGEPVERDESLARLETCPTFAPGLVRALRAELSSSACADVLIKPFLEAATDSPPADIRDALIGLALAGQLSRLVRDPPTIKPPFSKARFREFLAGPLGRWVAGQAGAIHRLALQGARLQGYGKGVAAVEAGLADMRFIEVVREVPLPEELARDTELRDVYYIALDEALEPRKDRGRDAALVGLRMLAEVGVLHDPRVDRARALLSKLYSGRRIDALDGLLLPPLPPLSQSTLEQRLAARVPCFYSGLLLRRANITEPGLLRALLERGVPAPFRQQLQSVTLPARTRWLYARSLVGLGQCYWRSADFARAAQFAELGSGAAGPGAEEARLLSALASALEGGPRDAAEMMLRGPFLPAPVGNVARLDALARSNSPLASLAAYNAAYILQLVPPAEPDPAFWEDLAQRYGRAAARLRDPKQRSAAREREQAARQTAEALAHSGE